MRNRQAGVHIDLDAINHNFQYVRQLAPGSRIMGIIKADAYGHGAVQVARKLKDADGFGVARISEAVRLREQGIGNPICLLEGVLNTEELRIASVYDLTVVIHDVRQVELMERADARRPVWVKVDTGMGRLGFRPEEVVGLLERLGRQQILGVMTHLADADDPSSAGTGRQVAAVRSLADKLGPGIAKQISIANSAGVVAHPASHADWVRPGIMLYGVSPMSGPARNDALHPAMTFSAPVISVRDIRQGETVGYGGIWTAERDTRVAVVAAGYGDGYPREASPGSPVLITGRRRELVGRVSMDMLCVRLEPDDTIEAGDRAVLWGEGLPVEEVAHKAGTIAYRLLCGVTERVGRVYRGEVRG